MITEDEDIKLLNEILGFELRDWQIKYIRGEWWNLNITSDIYERGTGKTTTYILYRLLSLPFDFTEDEISDYEDNAYGTTHGDYHHWFKHYMLGIDNILKANGFETFLVRNNT